MFEAYLVTKVPGVNNLHAVILKYYSFTKAMMDHQKLNSIYHLGSANILQTNQAYYLVCTKTVQPLRYLKIARASKSRNPKKALLNNIPLQEAKITTNLPAKNNEGTHSKYHYNILKILGSTNPQPKKLVGMCNNIMLAKTTR